TGKTNGEDVAPGSHTTDSVLQRKLFPFVTVMATDTLFGEQVESDSILVALAAAYHNRIAGADTCQDAGCYARALRCTPEEIEQAGDRLKALVLRHAPAWVTAVKASGYYAAHPAASDTSFVREVWEEM